MNKLITLVALLFDLFLGDPPNRFHPTAWMGSLIAFLKRFRPQGYHLVEFVYGFFIVLTGVCLTGGVAFLLERFAASLPAWAGVLLRGLCLSLTISLRGLDRAAHDVQSALEKRDLSEARRLLSWHLVSRDTSQLDESQVSAAAIESVAENASDGIIAPLFFYLIGGLPAAFAYRFANTADSMLGYHDDEHEWLGKFPARFDDGLNFIPARLTGLLIVLSAPWIGGNLKCAWQIMRRDSCTTASPNAGLPMSAMAGALGVELEKVGHYQLGKGLRPPTLNDLNRSRRLLFTVVGVFALPVLIWSMYAAWR